MPSHNKYNKRVTQKCDTSLNVFLFDHMFLRREFTQKNLICNQNNSMFYITLLSWRVSTLQNVFLCEITENVKFNNIEIRTGHVRTTHFVNYSQLEKDSLFIRNTMPSVPRLILHLVGTLYLIVGLGANSIRSTSTTTKCGYESCPPTKVIQDLLQTGILPSRN